MPDEWSSEMATSGGQWDSWGPSDDIEAFTYYGTTGLIDPKAPFEAWVMGGGRLAWHGFTTATLSSTWAARPSLVGFVGGLTKSFAAAMIIPGVIGWAVDPHDYREGGWVETHTPAPTTRTHRGWELENF